MATLYEIDAAIMDSLPANNAIASGRAVKICGTHGEGGTCGKQKENEKAPCHSFDLRDSSRNHTMDIRYFVDSGGDMVAFCLICVGGTSVCCVGNAFLF